MTLLIKNLEADTGTCDNNCNDKVDNVDEKSLISIQQNNSNQKIIEKSSKFLIIPKFTICFKCCNLF